MAGSNNSQEAQQFPGDTPLTGHNIQGHSLNVRLVREVPEDVLRNSVTHFGTRGMFGKAVRRTSQHDHDNVRRKKWRTAQSLKSKPTRDQLDEEPGQGDQEMSEDSTGVSVAVALQPAPGSAPGPANAVENTGISSPPSSSSTIASSPPLPPPSNESRRVTKRPPIQREYSLSEAAAEGKLPTSAYRDSHQIPSPTSLSTSQPTGSGVADISSRVPIRSMTYPTIDPPSRSTAPVRQSRSSQDIRFGTPGRTSAMNVANDVPLAPEPVGRRVNQGGLRPVRSLTSPAIHGRRSHQTPTLPSHSGAPGASPSARYGHLAAGRAEARGDGIPSDGVGVAERPSIPPSLRRDRSRIQGSMPMDSSGYAFAATMLGSASREHQGFVGRHPSTYPASLATTSTQNAPGDRAPAHVAPVPSDQHINALVDYYTRPPAPNVGGAVATSSGLTYTSPSAPEATWPMAPEPYPATAADDSFNMRDLHLGAFMIGANAGADASLSSTDSAASEVYYTHGFEGYLGASNAVARLPQHAQMNPDHINSAGGQRDDGAYGRAPSRSHNSPPFQFPRSHSD